jgi:hypothetical protein
MTKRLKYTKDILTHMLNNNNGTVKPGTSSDRVNGGGGTGALAGALGSQMTASSSLGGTGVPSRMGTITSAISSKRSLNTAGGMSDIGSMPSSVTGRSSGV